MPALNRVTATLSAAALGFAITTSAYAVVSTATPASVGHRPVATGNISATGALGPNQVITVNDFGMTDNDGDLIDISETMKTVQWYIMDGATITNIGTAGSATVTLPSDAAGKKLGLKYTIKTLTGIPKEAYTESDIILTTTNGGGVTGGGSDGEIGRGAAVDPTAVVITYASSPTDENNGTTSIVPVAGVTTLTADLTCVAGTSCEEGDFTYQWKVADAGTPGSLSDIVGATNKAYTLEKSDQNKVFVVDVNVKASVAP
ncbi:ZirU family protein [Yokenella regensburgei]|uniref:ZirU family protein n=1 Tax=Yokenella regensburgei TaxID=158877 RepID=UPI0027D9B212|nr:ZirU family protein [Yokenella regensburgei]MDQ4429028.1 ZirU family protein [Yokenella regensburgei]